jgi:hypothetical protein
MREYWTIEQLDLLREIYPEIHSKKVAEMLGKRQAQVAAKASSLKLKKSAAFFASPESGRINKNNDIGASTRFYKNGPGWNKGKKMVDYMSPENIEKTKKGHFKKGIDPHNTVPVGFERISKDGYIEVKFQHTKGAGSKNRNFEFKHRLMYVEHYGPIPEGMIVTIEGGDKINFNPGDLVLKSRKENMLQNSYCDSAIVKRFLKVRDPDMAEKIKAEMPELIQLKRNQLKLNNQINKQDGIR